jgi:uncharacterized membrane protein YbhN (UPF0104 family)
MKNWYSKNRQFLLRLIGTALAVGLLAFLLYKEGWADIVDAVTKIPARYLVTAALIVFLSRFFVIGRWHILLRSAGIDIKFSSTTSITFTGLFASNFLPTTIGGDVIRLSVVIQMGFDRAICLASLAADRLIGMFGMAMVVPVGLIPLWRWSASQTLQSAALGALWQRGYNFIRRTIQSFSIWLKNPKALFGSLACTWGHMLCTFAAAFLLIQGMGGNVNFWLVAGIYSLTYFVTLLPISINGYGVQELSLSYLMVHIGGMDMASGLALAVLIRAAFLIASLPGAAFLPRTMADMDRSRIGS